MQMINNFVERHNIRKAESIWLAFVHVIGLFGLIHVAMYCSQIVKYLMIMIVIHNAYGMGITVGAHRLWAHKSYIAFYPLKILLMLLNSGANQGSIYHWARDHRLHHKFSDTQYDPHTIKRGFFFAHVGWLLEKKSQKMVDEGRKINMDDLKADPVVMWQKRHYYKISFLMCFVVPSIIYSYALNCSFMVGYLYAALSYCLLLNSTWCVNSICHMFGNRPWDKDILPADNYFVSLITVGEGYHNWHHKNPSCWRASKDEWWMWNPSARFIELNRMLGLAQTKY